MDKIKTTAEQRRAEGLCTRCGIRPASEGFATCEICREKHRAYMKNYAKTDVRRAKKTALNRSYMSELKNRERWNRLNRERNKKLRSDAISAYGSVCVCCGEQTQEFLTLHHENGDGAEHRRSLGYGTSGSKGTGIQFYKWLRRNGWPQDLGLVVMCWNCHMAKDKFGECPHHR